MRDDELLDRRARMFERPQPTYAGTAAPGRGVMELPVRREPKQAVLESPSGRAMTAYGIVIDGLDGLGRTLRAMAQNSVMEAIREQLAPGEEVKVYMSGYDALRQTYDVVEIGENESAIVAPGTDVRTIRGGLPGDPGYGNSRPPSRENFSVPTTDGLKLISIPTRRPEKPSPSNNRPGRGELGAWGDRWSRDPGLIDHDFARADVISRTA